MGAVWLPVQHIAVAVLCHLTAAVWHLTLGMPTPAPWQMPLPTGKPWPPGWCCRPALSQPASCCSVQTTSRK